MNIEKLVEDFICSHLLGAAHVLSRSVAVDAEPIVTSIGPVHAIRLLNFNDCHRAPPASCSIQQVNEMIHLCTDIWPSQVLDLAVSE